MGLLRVLAALASAPLVRLRGVVGWVSPSARTWYGRAVGALGCCSSGRAFQIVPDLHGDGGAAAEEPPCTAGERGRETGKLQPGESSGAERAPWVCTPVGCTQGGDRPGLEKDTGAFLTCRSSRGLQSRGDSPRTGARVAISAPASRTAVHIMLARLSSHRCGRASNGGGGGMDAQMALS